MPFNELPRRDSWPPTVIHLPAQTSETDPNDLSDIDSNPISFFLTTPTYDQDLELDFPSPEYDDLEDLSAGIEGSPESKALPAIREISPSSLQRSKLESLLPENEEDEDMGIWDVDMDTDMDDDIDGFEATTFGMGMPMTLKDFTNRHNQLLNRSPPPTSRCTRSKGNSDRPKGLGISLPHHQNLDPNLPKRGRAKVRLAPGTGTTPRGRGRARTLSARRPQSWRVPSPEIYSIEEEREERDTNNEAMNIGRRVESRRGHYDDAGYSASAPTVVSCMVREGDKKKKVPKRVHWAL